MATPTTVAIQSIVALPTQVTIAWLTDVSPTITSAVYVSPTLNGLSDPAIRFLGNAATQIPNNNFSVGPFPVVGGPVLLADTMYYCRANADGILSPIQGFVTPPAWVVPTPILTRMFAKPVKISRPGFGVYNPATGGFIQATGTSFNALCSIQPLTMREMMIFPEGERTKQALKIYSDVRLQEAIQQTGQKGDCFEYNGRQYEVKQSGTWNKFGRTRISFWKSMAVSVEQDAQI